jgi:hypothetical protein
MLATIQFDDQLSFQANEVHDITTDQKLALELVSRKAAIPNLPPKFAFCIGENVTHASSMDALDHAAFADGSGVRRDHLSPSP